MKPISWTSILCGFLLLTGCSATTQSSSGSDYLKAYPNNIQAKSAADAQSGKPLTLDEEVAKAAAVDPLIHFPIKIGLARVEYARLTPIPENEAQLWNDLGTRLGSHYGQFVVVDPMVAEFTAQSMEPSSNSTTPLQSLVRRVRLGAARQHVDAVLVYETHSNSKKEDTPLQLLNWTIIGYYIAPSTSVQAQAVSNAMFMDVRNGYPYATIQGKGSAETFTVGNQVSNALHDRGEAASLDAVKNLIEQIEPTLKKLEQELPAGKSPS